MTSARETILSRLEQARPPASEAPAAMSGPPRAGDEIGTLRRHIEAAGGRLQVVSRANGGLAGVRWPIDLDTTRHLHSSIPEVESRGVGTTSGSDRELADLDLCILPADFAVVENGAAWQIPARPRERSAALLAEHLVLVVDAQDLVPTMHEAYERIDLGDSHFGWFLCGPSKTADIEQALVLGAHGPKTMTLVLVDD